MGSKTRPRKQSGAPSQNEHDWGELGLSCCQPFSPHCRLSCFLCGVVEFFAIRGGCVGARLFPHTTVLSRPSAGADHREGRGEQQRLIAGLVIRIQQRCGAVQNPKAASP